MKNIKRILALLCVFSLVFSIALTSSAFASEPQYTSTKNVLSYFDTKDVEYTYVGIVEDDEWVWVTRDDLDYYESLICFICFSENNREVNLRTYSIVTCSAGKNYALNAINAINQDYKWVKMVYDESDSTIHAELDMFVDSGHCGRPVHDAMHKMFQILDYRDVAAALHGLE